jgi:hypothetical protein
MPVGIRMCIFYHYNYWVGETFEYVKAVLMNSQLLWLLHGVDW